MADLGYLVPPQFSRSSHVGGKLLAQRLDRLAMQDILPTFSGLLQVTR
jgi:hypothetical protein